MNHMNQQKYHPDSGFSLLEVLVSIIVITFFTAAAMQMMVVSAAFKAKAKEYTLAKNLIQQDLEIVRNKASEYVFPSANFEASDAGVVEETDSSNPTFGQLYIQPHPSGSPAATTIKLSSVEELSNNHEIQFVSTKPGVPGTPDVYTNYSLNTTNKTITIASPGIETSVFKDTVVVDNTLCNAGSASTGLAARLQTKTATNLIAPPVTFTYDSTNYQTVSGYAPYVIKDNLGNDTQKKIWVMRNDTTVDATPYEVLKINYLVVPEDDQNPGRPDDSPERFIAQVSSEVIPNASYQCPK